MSSVPVVESALDSLAESSFSTAKQQNLVSGCENNYTIELNVLNNGQTDEGHLQRRTSLIWFCTLTRSKEKRRELQLKFNLRELEALNAVTSSDFTYIGSGFKSGILCSYLPAFDGDHKHIFVEDRHSLNSALCKKVSHYIQLLLHMTKAKEPGSKLR